VGNFHVMSIEVSALEQVCYDKLVKFGCNIYRQI